jgi:tRNA-Thr(GGU) m(6)t(6)A37 methyltransferase TsaA
MNNNQGTIKESYQLYPIGYVRRGEDGGCRLEILAPYRPALKQLDQFSHVMVFWWADQHDNEQGRSLLQTRPPYAEDRLTGVFACRSEYRPNPIAMTICQIWGVDQENGLVQVTNIDAYDGTALVDLKAYFPVCDRVKEAHIPGWLSDWPAWMPAEGIGL